jgi:tetratricopeptide (TPR) repeat protein
MLLAPVAAAAVHYNGADQSGNYVGLHYAQDLLEPLAPNALLLMRGDENYTTVDYAQYVTHLRPDVVALDTELLKLPSYIAQKKLEHPGVVIPFTTYRGSVKALDDLVSANLGQRPVYYVGAPEHASFGEPFDQQRAGLARRLLPKGTAPDQYALLERDPGRFERLRYPLRSYPKTSWETAIAEDYGGPAFDVAFALQRNGSPADLKEAEKMYRIAIRDAPSEPSAYKNLGLILRGNGGDPKEIIALWDRFLQLKPDDPQAPEIRRVLASLKAKS